MKRLAVVILVVLFSCSDKSIQSKIIDVDRVVVIDNKTRFSHVDTSKLVVESFKNVLKGQPELTECMSQGTILFKEGNNTMLEAGYYKDASTCNFLIIEKDGKKEGYRLDFNTLAYLGLYFQKLKKQQDGKRH